MIDDYAIRRINELKKHTFFEILELSGRVFIVVDYDEKVIIGRRGFLPEEKERGLVLVFTSRMKFTWEDDILNATLIFGNNPEKCHIPVSSIAAVFSPDLRIQLTAPVFKKRDEETSEDISKENKEDIKNSKIININNFRKRK